VALLSEGAGGSLLGRDGKRPWHPVMDQEPNRDPSVDLFLFADHYLSPVSFRRDLIVRLLLITPLALTVSLSLLLQPGERFREVSITILSSLAGLTHLYLESGKDMVVSAYVQPGVLAVVLFTNVVMRLQFPYAVATSAVMLVGDIFFLRLDSFLLIEQKILGLGLALGTICATLISNYGSNREERLNYLLRLREELLVADLNRMNAKLQRRSESDALTGLANRHSFDMQYAKLWREAVTAESPISVVVVDVDHFKRINDVYGHLYGDEVLKRIGSLLLQALRVKGDFAARFGGEEFVILLPNTDQTAALQVAERLRRLVELSGFPALDPSDPRPDVKATVSCGVAMTVPTALEGRQMFLDAADKAMYRAKTMGRNCVCLASAGKEDAITPSSSLMVSSLQVH
jgi:diguanylate cyclase (GGDEF)-like protein